MTALPYFLTASLYLLLFYSCYWLLLRQNTFFGLNRAYLLVSIGLSLFLPFIELPDGAETLPGPINLPTFTIGTAPMETSYLSTAQWFWLAYGLGVCIMLIRFGLNVRSVLQLIGQGKAEKRATFILVRLPHNLTPSFSFGRYLVLNRTDALAQPDALLRHEEAHIRQHHTADVLCLEVVRIAFWFNPVLWLYKRALQEVHEFLADRAVLKTPQPDYPQKLVAYALNISPTALITPFVSKSTLKQRIVMLKKPASNRRALLGYVLALPLAALLVMCTQQEHDLPQTDVTARKSVKVDGEIFTVVEQQPVFPGGMKKLSEYLGTNLKYPAAAQKVKAEGKVFVSFIVTKTGEITDVQILKGIGYGADEEAVRVVKNMPSWTPAQQDGQPVNVKFNLPINFQLEEKKSSQPSSDDAAFKGIKHFIINGKEVTKAEILAVPTPKIASMDVLKDKATISITTR